MRRIYKYPTVTTWYPVHHIYTKTDLLESLRPKSMHFSSSNHHKIVFIQERGKQFLSEELCYMSKYILQMLTLAM